MKRFSCSCGSHVFFDNSFCVACNRALGFDPEALQMKAVREGDDGTLLTDTGETLRHCRNRIEYDVCNWFADGDNPFCKACAMNEVIPDLGVPGNKLLWYRLEKAKRRLVYSLFTLQLPTTSNGVRRDLRFHFLEDKRRNPNAPEAFVSTGHNDGVITINVAEADTIARHRMRKLMQERYRTLLGHFRHESGHYYLDFLVQGARDEFLRLFGDPAIDYASAMKRHYESGPPADWESSYISAYASSHPWEDWAEIFAHYLHITDTLETAAWVIGKPGSGDWIQRWLEDSAGINEICLSLGIDKAYPFVLNEKSIAKLRFVASRVTEVSPMEDPAISA